MFIILEMIARTTQSASRRLQVLHLVNLLAKLAISHDAALALASVPALLPVLGALVSSSKAAAQTHWLCDESSLWASVLLLTAAAHLIQTAGQFVGEGGTTASAYTVLGKEQQQQVEEVITGRAKQQGQGGGRLEGQSKQQEVAWRHLEVAAQQWLREMCPSLSLVNGQGQQGLELSERGLKDHFWLFLWAGLHLVFQADGCSTDRASIPSSMAASLVRKNISELEKTLQCTLAKAARVIGDKCGAVLKAMEELQDGGDLSLLGSFAWMVSTMVPMGFCCNNPDCSELGGLSELGLVQGPEGARGVCAGCGLACYCSRACQEKVWCAHSNVCKEYS